MAGGVLAVSAFMRMLWSGRDRHKPNAQLQERMAAYTLNPARNVQAVPQRMPRIFLFCECPRCAKEKRDA